MMALFNTSNRPSYADEGRLSFEPKIQFIVGKPYVIHRKSARKDDRIDLDEGTRFYDHINARFLGEFKGDRWLKHYLFDMGNGARQCFTQIQLSDYEVKEVK